MTQNQTRQVNAPPARGFNPNPARALAMLRACPAYQPTPMIANARLAAELGVSSVYVKDETNRMRLGSFKALGGAFAVAQMICTGSGETDPTSGPAKAAAAKMTFIAASAGNHGLSVAAGARIFGARACIVLSASVPDAFARRIRALNADVIRVDGDYQQSVTHAMALAGSNDWLLLADGSWQGYTERPALVMEGYTVLAEECREQFMRLATWPTHVFVQAGVGGLAAAIAAHIRAFWPHQPRVIIVEPEAAPCLAESIKAQRMVQVSGPVSNMGRLDCKDASLIAFDSLRHDADDFVTIRDAEAADGVDTLAAHGLVTTPSGAASLAAVPYGRVSSVSRVLVFVTEGGESG